MKKSLARACALAPLLFALGGSFEAATADQPKPGEMVLENRSSAAVLYVLRRTDATRTGCLSPSGGRVTIREPQMIAVKFTFLAKSPCNGAPLQPAEVYPYADPKTTLIMHGRAGSKYTVTVAH